MSYLSSTLTAMNDIDGDVDFTDLDYSVRDGASDSSSTSSFSLVRRRSSFGPDLPVSSKRARHDESHEDLAHFGVMDILGQGSSSATTSGFSFNPGLIMEPSQAMTSNVREDDVDILSTMGPTKAPEKHYNRDPKYYMEDGSCILLVEDTLFNVHRSMLSRDGSSFTCMFSLPQGGHESEGRSDDSPIILSGDTVTEFRHFLWALYALPPELRIVNSPSADLDQLMSIARISNKYSFKSLETWALDAIQEYVNQKPSPILNSIPHPTSFTFSPAAARMSVDSPGAIIDSTGIANTGQLTRLIRLAQMCSHERLLNTVVALLRQLMSSSLQYAYLAMTLADELDLRALRGAAYLELMHKTIPVKKSHVDTIGQPKATQQQPAAQDGTGSGSTQDADPIEADTAVSEDRLVVNPSQQLRLLSGYYRLSQTWERLRKIPPHFDHAPSCGATWHQHGCTQSWLEFWKEKTRGDTVLSYGLADVLGRLRQVQKEYDRWGSATYMHHDCRMAARRSIQELIKSVEDALPDYFSEGAED